MPTGAGIAYGSIFTYFRDRIGLQFPDLLDAIESKVSVQIEEGNYYS